MLRQWSAGYLQQLRLPVVFDLDGDGIELIGVEESKARFNIDGDGHKERIGWVGKDDGILVLDRNANGRIDDFSEMSFLSDFRGAGSDLEGLMAYDGNGDGRLDRADARFGEFMIWRDAKWKRQFGEGRAVHSRGAGDNLHRSRAARHPPMDVVSESNQILATAHATRSDGSSILIGDVALFAYEGAQGFWVSLRNCRGFHQSVRFISGTALISCRFFRLHPPSPSH